MKMKTTEILHGFWAGTHTASPEVRRSWQQISKTIEASVPEEQRKVLAYSAGADVKAVSEILGHASASVTLDTYAHLTDEKKRQQEEIVRAIKVL